MSKLFLLFLIIAIIVSIITGKWIHGVLIAGTFAIVKIGLNLIAPDRA